MNDINWREPNTDESQMLLGMYPDDALIAITRLGDFRLVLDRSELQYMDGQLCLIRHDSLPGTALPIVRVQHWAFLNI